MIAKNTKRIAELQKVIKNLSKLHEASLVLESQKRYQNEMLISQKIFIEAQKEINSSMNPYIHHIPNKHSCKKWALD